MIPLWDAAGHCSAYGRSEPLGRADVAPEVLMLLARAFARAELDPGRSVQQAMVNAIKAQSRSGPTALSPEELSDHFAELAAALDNDPFAIYAELASMAAAFQRSTMPRSPGRRTRPCERRRRRRCTNHVSARRWPGSPQIDSTARIAPAHFRDNTVGCHSSPDPGQPFFNLIICRARLSLSPDLGNRSAGGVGSAAGGLVVA